MQNLNKVRILIVVGKIWQNVIFRLVCVCVCVCVCVEVFEVDNSIFLWVQFGINFSRLVNCKLNYIVNFV
jgi:hypothetical protein